MRIYFQFLLWLLRKFKFGPPKFLKDMFKWYRLQFLEIWPIALMISLLPWTLLSFTVLVVCAMCQTTKQQMLDAEFYAMIFMMGFVVYNWLAAWYGVFQKERQDLMDMLAEG